MGLSRGDSERFVEAVIGEMAAGETVTIANFGSFVTRGKAARIARNPKTGSPRSWRHGGW